MFLVDCTFPTPARWGGKRKEGAVGVTLLDAASCLSKEILLGTGDRRKARRQKGPDHGETVLWQVRAGPAPRKP